ncbi:VOC family protein [Bradyrhizobium sp. NP1]|uniref:VOC family protein n=1 Tax=Bradyrhizobium sp. NP1 TaxID=3049772 RepID=UPI0025A61DCB|nr:VOC family protein [Bradyrhizobium sp. NP1]WJR80217.1 VOC family protein [Bradyrhizobium sp. NP1]
MSRIRHIALSVPDPEKTADFYVKTFGLRRVGKTESVLASGVYLSDGYINLALLRYHNDEVAGVSGGKDFVGVHHFGFQVESAEAAKGSVESNGGSFFMDLPALKDTLYYEEKYRDPDGIIFDVSQNGWATKPE